MLNGVNGCLPQDLGLIIELLGPKNQFYSALAILLHGAYKALVFVINLLF